LEQRAVLGLPLREAIEGLVPWVLAALIFGALNLVAYDNGVAYTLRTFLSIILGGLAASAIAYLLAERTLRPVFALALSGHVPQRAGSLGVRAKLLLSGALGCGVFLVTIGLSYLGRPAAQPPTAAAIWFLVGSGLAAGFIVLYAAARSLADPLQRLRQAVQRVQLGDLDVHVDVDDAGELGLLQAGSITWPPVCASAPVCRTCSGGMWVPTSPAKPLPTGWHSVASGEKSACCSSTSSAPPNSPKRVLRTKSSRF
jgi:adenylate cyclase